MNWIGLLLLIIHIGACSGLILIVLLQAGKGASLGAAFGGGSSQTVFGAQSASFIAKLTWVLAGSFMATSLLLAIISPWGEIGSEGKPAILQEEPIAQPPPGETPHPGLPGMTPSAEDLFVLPEQAQQGEPATEPVVPLETRTQTESEPAPSLPDTQQQP